LRVLAIADAAPHSCGSNSSCVASGFESTSMLTLPVFASETP
jgi:hypothetical protein